MSKLILPRRKIIAGLAAGLVCAPAVVRAGTIPLLGAGKAPGGGGAKGLQTNLGSFFSLDNTLNDSTGNVSALTNNNTVTFVSPPGGGLAAVTNCANFVSASSQYLSHIDATGLNVAGIDFSIQLWYYTTSNQQNAISAKGQNSFGNNEWRFSQPFNATPQFELNNSGSMTGAAVTTSAWHHVVVTFNNTSKAAIMYIDGASSATNTYTGATGTGTGQFNIGSSLGAAPSVFYSGNQALVGTWRNRILSSGDVTLLYNGGAGLSYAGML